MTETSIYFIRASPEKSGQAVANFYPNENINIL